MQGFCWKVLAEVLLGLCGLQVPTRYVPKIKTLKTKHSHPNDLLGWFFCYLATSMQVGNYMGEIEKTIEVFERLRQHKYKISIETGDVFILKFSPEHYHHLAGFQHLDDLTHISAPHLKDKFYRDVKKGTISEETIIASKKYPEIAERIQSFDKLEDILCSGECKIIVSFDAETADSKINAEYYLYRRDGAAIKGNVTYYHLFLGYDLGRDLYYPATYIVEHSNLYMRGQHLLNCEIEILDK